MKTYFKNINTAEELKNQFRTLCQTMHPDKGGNAQEFAEMLNEYENKLKTAGAWTKQERAQVDEWAEILSQSKRTTRGAVLNVGDFVQMYDTMEKCNDLRDFVSCFVRYHLDDMTAEEYKKENIMIGKIEAVIYMTDEELQKFPFLDEKPAGAGNGGNWGPIYDSEKKPMDEYRYNPHDHEHFYYMVTAIITPSRFVFIDCEGYNYTRCLFLPEYFDEFPEFRETVEAIEAERRAEEEAERQAEEARKAADRAAVEKWAGILEEIPAVGAHDWSKAGRKARQTEEAKQKAAFKRNIKAVFNHYFPGVKVTVKDTNPTYFKESEISWIDGPTVAEVEAVPEWSQFLGWEYYKDDPYDDYSQRRGCSGFEEFRAKFGAWSANDVKFNRTLSEAEKAKAEAKACELFPQLATEEARATECGKGVNISYSEAYAAAAFFGLSFWAGVDGSTLTEEERDELNRKEEETENARRHFVRFVSSENHYNDKTNIYDVLKIFAEFWKVEQPQAKASKTAKEATQTEPAQDQTAAGEILAEADGVTMTATENGAQLTGNTYAHKDEIKTAGARWFRRGQCWTITAEKVGEFVELVNSWKDSGEATEAELTTEAQEATEPTTEPTTEETTARPAAVEISETFAGAFVECVKLWQDFTEATTAKEATETTDTTATEPATETTDTTEAQEATEQTEPQQETQQEPQPTTEKIRFTASEAEEPTDNTTTEEKPTTGQKIRFSVDDCPELEELKQDPTEPTEPTDPGTPTGGAPDGVAQMTEEEREKIRQHFTLYARHVAEATEDNDHTTALIWQATALIWHHDNRTIKAATLLNELEAIKERHEKRGNISREDYDRRHEIHDELIIICMREYGADLAAVLFGRGTVDYIQKEKQAAA